MGLVETDVTLCCRRVGRRSPKGFMQSSPKEGLIESAPQVCLSDTVPRCGKCLGTQGKMPADAIGEGTPWQGPPVGGFELPGW